MSAYRRDQVQLLELTGPLRLVCHFFSGISGDQ